MSTRQTRRQAAQAAREASSPGTSEPASPQEDDSLMNGNGKARAPAPPDAADQENIFLFWPNIIGNAPRAPRSPSSRPR